MRPAFEVLIIDNEKPWLDRLVSLIPPGVPHKEASSAEDAIALLQSHYFHCALVDQSLSTDGKDQDGVRVINHVVTLDEGTRCCLVTAFGDAEAAFALGGLKIDGYILKQTISSAPNAIEDKIARMLELAREDYSRRYANGIDQLTAGDVPSPERGVWLDSVITQFSAKTRSKVGFKETKDLLDNLVRGIAPLLPLSRRALPKIDHATGLVRGEYWSKALAQGVAIEFGVESTFAGLAEPESTPKQSVKRGQLFGQVVPTKRSIAEFI